MKLNCLVSGSSLIYIWIGEWKWYPLRRIYVTKKNWFECCWNVHHRSQRKKKDTTENGWQFYLRMIEETFIHTIYTKILCTQIRNTWGNINGIYYGKKLIYWIRLGFYGTYKHLWTYLYFYCIRGALYTCEYDNEYE